MDSKQISRRLVFVLALFLAGALISILCGRRLEAKMGKNYRRSETRR